MEGEGRTTGGGGGQGKLRNGTECVARSEEGRGGRVADGDGKEVIRTEGEDGVEEQARRRAGVDRTFNSMSPISTASSRLPQPQDRTSHVTSSLP